MVADCASTDRRAAAWPVNTNKNCALDVQTIVASGRVETPHRVEIGAPITGTVRRVPVHEGQTVVAGAALVELESAELQASLAQEQRAVQAALARQ